jgi:hypothetical protein
MFDRLKPGRKAGSRKPLRAAGNKGPIGPLDSEPPFWSRDDVFDVADVTRILREMGADIGDRDIEQAIADGTGPLHNIRGVRTIRLGDAIDWSQRYIRKDNELTRKEATEYIRSLGYQISDTALQQHPNHLPFVTRGRDTIYTKEDCREWVEAKKARGLPPGTFAPKYKPPHTQRRCPSTYKLCPTVKHEDCKKYAQAWCNVAHLPNDPKLLALFEAVWSGSPDAFERLRRLRPKHHLFQYPAERPDKRTNAIASYLAAWEGA